MFTGRPGRLLAVPAPHFHLLSGPSGLVVNLRLLDAHDRERGLSHGYLVGQVVALEGKLSQLVFDISRVSCFIKWLIYLWN